MPSCILTEYEVHLLRKYETCVKAGFLGQLEPKGCVKSYAASCGCHSRSHLIKAAFRDTTIKIRRPTQARLKAGCGQELPKLRYS